MALDMFFKINGVTGESKDADASNVGTIDVLAWSWGMSQSGSFHSGGGGGSGKANVQDLSFTKWIDAASPPLQLMCLTGKHITEAVLSVRKAGDKPYVYLKITLTKLLVSSVSTGGSGGEDRLTENVTLNFAKAKVEYFKQADDGSVSAAGDYTFDVEANAKS
ncbi:Hcp family type VI secretion system effector [Sandarakinorhabdus oryzae]|uniref:Hcp family type VI secretion system effector n=1 Tax=Sandarakinorhabdus oryzae TaxID=2675220 RepID=UPI0012E24EE3|nr:type VI secretion system tube protein Hcp [Sandarakinorhabdus oryzae]